MDLHFLRLDAREFKLIYELIEKLWKCEITMESAQTRDSVSKDRVELLLFASSLLSGRSIALLRIGSAGLRLLLGGLFLVCFR